MYINKYILIKKLILINNNIHKIIEIISIEFNP